MIQSNLAFKIVNQILKIKNSKNFFVIEKSSFYAEPFLFHVLDVFIPFAEYSKTKLPKDFGLYSFTTNVQIHHLPKKKVVLNENSVTYQIYGIRSETVFYIVEICKKNHNTLEKISYCSDKLTTQESVNLLMEMDKLLTSIKCDTDYYVTQSSQI
ncbi:hypothetical protein KBD45_06950 [Candidatus Dojkabacteria bacterium]|nr:hypothetical protein [Candidatus Dojkabacteria bacterium]